MILEKIKNNIKRKFVTARNDRVFKGVFVDEYNHYLMESLLSECLDKKVKIIKYKKVELGVSNVSEKSKRLDVIVECEGKRIIVELNTEGPSINKTIEIAKNMLKDNFSISNIVKYTGLTAEEIEKLKKA